MTASDERRHTTPGTLTDQQIDSYRRDGFVHLPGVISRRDAARFAKAALAARDRLSDFRSGTVFTQTLQLWRNDETLRELTLDQGLAGIATLLAGIPLRLWHDQLLVKDPHNGAATEFHQDQPYWPHAGSRNALSAWVALVDVPAERGCMTFIPGSQRLTGLRAQDLTDHDDLMSLVPDLLYQPRVTVPLRAGDCTFHNSRLAHSAAPNHTDAPRVAHVVIYTDVETRFAARPRHPITGPLGLAPGDRLPDEHFPRFDVLPENERQSSPPSEHL